MDDIDIAQSATLTDFAMCLNHYRLSTPGLYVCVHIPVQLDERTKVIPGLIAQVNSGPFKQCDPSPSDYRYFNGPPNFVFDVFRADQHDSYHLRRDRFERSGVIEYVAWFTSDAIPVWNRLVHGSFTIVQPDETGMIKSAALPGLWIPVEALKNRNWWAVMATISQGITRRGHRDFMATIWKD